MRWSEISLRILNREDTLSPERSIEGKNVFCATCGERRRCVNYVCYECMEKDFRKTMETEQALEDRRIELRERNEYSLKANFTQTDDSFSESSSDDDDSNFLFGDEGAHNYYGGNTALAFLMGLEAYEESVTEALSKK